MVVRIRFLEIHEVGAGGFQQAVDIEHGNPLLCLFERQTLIGHGGTHQIGKTNGR